MLGLLLAAAFAKFEDRADGDGSASNRERPCFELSSPIAPLLGHGIKAKSPRNKGENRPAQLVENHHRLFIGVNRHAKLTSFGG